MSVVVYVSWNEVSTVYSQHHGAGTSGLLVSWRKLDWRTAQQTCLFYRTHEESFLYDAMYIDDGLIIGNKDEEFEMFQGLLQEEFKITIGSLPPNAY